MSRSDWKLLFNYMTPEFLNLIFRRHPSRLQAHAKLDCSERLIGLSAAISVFGAQNKQSLVAHAKRDCSERLIGLSAAISVFGAQNKQPLVAQHGLKLEIAISGGCAAHLA